jgi:hypothetical protein
MKTWAPHHWEWLGPDGRNYEIHDYKTNSRLPLPDYIHADRQLALYVIGVKNNYPDVKDVRLIWHFLKFDKETVVLNGLVVIHMLFKSEIKLIIAGL